jgi:uncharacterized BrkB/YihY/UPF0761 family membrane protein
LLLDLLFPALIYCLLLAPTLTPSAAGISYMDWIVFTYFAFAIVYAVLLRREVSDIDRFLLRVVLTAFGLSALALLSSYLVRSVVLRAVLGDVLATAAVGLWATYNLRLVYQIMHSDERPTES